MYRNVFTFQNDKMNINEFIEYINKNKEYFTCYCEILIDNLGFIYLARPNHQNAIVAIAAKQNNQSFDEYYKEIPKECSPLHWTVSKDNIVAVWYNTFVGPAKLTKFQKRTMNLLQRYGIILKPISGEISNEYQRYLKRQELYNSCKDETLQELKEG